MTNPVKMIKSPSRTHKSMRPAIALVGVLMTVAVVDACNIPVFRYALERWKPDACELIVFDDGLSDDQRTIIDKLEKAAAGDNVANVTLVRFDLSKGKVSGDRSKLPPGSDDQIQSLYETLNVSGSHVVVRTKVGGGALVNHWHGPIDKLPDLHLLQSPARKEIRRRMLSGHSVVWLMLRSNDKKRNEEVRQRMTDNLDQLTKTVAIPEGVGLPGSELHSEIPLLVKFSILELSPDDPKEKYLVDLLSGFYPDAVTSGDPLLVPVFGRGRALEVIPASDINARLTEGLTQFLSGACSCQVKEQNPGFDLLISADWDTELFGEDGERPPPAKASPRTDRPQLLTIPPGRKR